MVDRGSVVNSMVVRGSVVNSMAGHWSQAFCLLLVKTVFVLKHKKKNVDTIKMVTAKLGQTFSELSGYNLN